MSTRIPSLLFVAALLSALPAYAMPRPDPSQNDSQTTPQTIALQARLPDGKKQVARLAKALKLKSEQNLSVRAIFAERDREIEIVKENGGLSEDGKSARITFILVESNGQIAAELNERQRKRFDEILARQSERQKEEGSRKG